jgi:hypothetical protein
MRTKKGTRIKITATVDELTKEGISRYHAEKMQNSEGVIVKKIVNDKFIPPEYFHVEINQMRWSLKRNHFRIIESENQ